LSEKEGRMTKNKVNDYNSEKSFSAVYIPSIVKANERHARLAAIHQRHDETIAAFRRTDPSVETSYYTAILDLGWLLDQIEDCE